MLRFLTAGESHGPALVVVVEGLPAGLPVTVEEIQAELARRRLGFGRGPRMRFEQDEVEFLGGVRHGRTLGSPVAIEIGNTEWDRPDKWQEEMSPGAEDGPTRRRSPSPGPATPTWPACRSTASTTPATCSSGPRPGRPRPGSPPARWPRRCSRELGVDGAVATSIQMGAAPLQGRDRAPARPTSTAVDESQVRCFDPAAEAAMVAEIKAAAKDGDSLGGVVEVLAYGVPVGLGSHVHWDRKLDGLLAQALMSIQAVKGVEIGDGFEVAGRRGSEAHDPIPWDADAGAYRRESDAGRRHRGRHVHRRAARRPGGDEAAGHAQPARC